MKRGKGQEGTHHHVVDVEAEAAAEAEAETQQMQEVRAGQELDDDCGWRLSPLSLLYPTTLTAVVNCYR